MEQKGSPADHKQRGITHQNPHQKQGGVHGGHAGHGGVHGGGGHGGGVVGSPLFRALVGTYEVETLTLTLTLNLNLNRNPNP